MTHQGASKNHPYLYGMAERALDIMVLSFGAWGTSTYLGNAPSDALPWFIIAGPLLFLFFAEITGLYRDWRNNTFASEVETLFSTWFIWALTLLISHQLLLSGAQKISFSLPLAMAACGVCLLMLFLTHLVKSMLLYGMRTLGRNTRNAMIIGQGKAASDIIEQIESSPWLGIRIRHVFPSLDALGSKGPEQTLSTLKEYIHRDRIDYVYLALPVSDSSMMLQVIEALLNTTATLFLSHEDESLMNLRLSGRSLGKLPLLALTRSPFHGLAGVAKRAEDLVLSSLIILVVAPLMLLIAVGIKLSSRGPVLFKQQRHGLDGRPIEVWKFRTMNVCEDGNDIRQATRNDPRVYPFGAFLRKTSLDELPQFFNVLRGEMSIVGPRPHALIHNEMYRKDIPGYMLRHKVKPGITGLAQINGCRGETPNRQRMEERIRLDLEYITNWTIWLDLKIILLTPFRLFGDPHAY